MKKWLAKFKVDDIEDEMRTVSYKEFWAICLAMYRTILPRTLILAVSLLVVSILLKWFFS